MICIRCLLFAIPLLATEPCHAVIDVLAPDAFVVNGRSHHIEKPKQVDPNENNYGFGVSYDWKDSDRLKVWTGFYDNSYEHTSVYGGISYKRRYGHDIYFEPGFFLGIITGYEISILPAVIPYTTIGIRNHIAVNILYGIHTHYTSEVIMVNFSIPLGN